MYTHNKILLSKVLFNVCNSRPVLTPSQFFLAAYEVNIGICREIIQIPTTFGLRRLCHKFVESCVRTKPRNMCV